MFSLDKVHMILDEIILNGTVVDTMRNNIMQPLLMLERSNK